MNTSMLGQLCALISQGKGQQLWLGTLPNFICVSVFIWLFLICFLHNETVRIVFSWVLWVILTNYRPWEGPWTLLGFVASWLEAQVAWESLNLCLANEVRVILLETMFLNLWNLVLTWGGCYQNRVALQSCGGLGGEIHESLMQLLTKLTQSRENCQFL
jgi:hypothetical protein